MAKATAASLRSVVVEGREKGKTLQELSFEYGISYATVQRLCYRQIVKKIAFPVLLFAQSSYL